MSQDAPTRHPATGKFVPRGSATPPDFQPGPAEPGPRDTFAPPNPGSATPGHSWGPPDPGTRGGGEAEPGHRLRPAARSPREAPRNA
jgi:hypothetical protein